MSNFNAALRTHIRAEADIFAIVGERIFPAGEEANLVNDPRRAFPLITFQRVSTERVPHLGGTTTLAGARIQVNCWSLDADQSESLGRLVRIRMDGLRGNMGVDPNVVVVESCHLEDEEDRPQRRADDRDLFVFQRRLDFRIWHRESVTNST